ncbi:MAG: sorbosone dehydrogenase [Flavobacteriia bacterium]|nr:sorbosone dehydrogenase [Flavobacteriia bacterium]
MNSARIALLFLAFFIACTPPVTQQQTVQLPPADKDNGGLFLPDGFGALVVVDSIGPSRHLAVRDNGDIYVKLSIVEGKEGNVALRDNDGDGKADTIQRFGDYLNDGRFATEMRIHKGYLYFSAELTVYRQKLTPGQLIPEGTPEIIMIDEFPIRWHNAKSLAFDHRGGMYVTFSAPTNACEDAQETGDDPDAIVRGEVPCSQLNILGGIWRFDENTLYQTQAEGYRYATGIRSVVGRFPAHWAPNDLLFYQGDQFPPRYKNGAFVAFHGSTNRSPYPQAGYVVAFVPFKEGKPAGPWEVFADGFIGDSPIAEMKQAQYRPMGLAEGPDGSLYISDSKQGKIWRVVYQKDPREFTTVDLKNMALRQKNQPHIKQPDPIKDRTPSAQ